MIKRTRSTLTKTTTLKKTKKKKRKKMIQLLIGFKTRQVKEFQLYCSNSNLAMMYRCFFVGL